MIKPPWSSEHGNVEWETSIFCAYFKALKHRKHYLFVFIFCVYAFCTHINSRDIVFVASCWWTTQNKLEKLTIRAVCVLTSPAFPGCSSAITITESVNVEDMYVLLIAVRNDLLNLEKKRNVENSIQKCVLCLVWMLCVPLWGCHVEQLPRVSRLVLKTCWNKIEMNNSAILLTQSNANHIIFEDVCSPSGFWGLWYVCNKLISFKKEMPNWQLTAAISLLTSSEKKNVHLTVRNTNPTGIQYRRTMWLWFWALLWRGTMSNIA